MKKFQTKEKKPKKHYEVYYVGKGWGCYAEDYQRAYLGDVWAVSEKQACNFVRFRHRDNKCPNGGYNDSYLGDCLDEGAVHFTYEAIEI